MHSKWIRNNIVGLMALFIALSGTAVAAQNLGSSAVAQKAAKKKVKLGPRGPQGPQGPVGPATGTAGGDLTGTYPNPTIGPNAVGSAEVTPDTLGAVDIAPDAIGASETGPDSVGTSEIGTDTVGHTELKITYLNVSGGLELDANQFGDQTAFCNAGDIALGGGHSWDNTSDETHMVHSTPDPLVAPNKWAVRGSTEANDNTLFAWVVCLAA